MNKLLEIFQSNLAEGRTVYGPFAKSCDPAFIEISAYAGFDFVILDMEHGPVAYENLQNLVRASILGNMLPVVRVESNEETGIGKALDSGAMGVQVPQVTNADEAQSAIRAAKFYPLGERGVCRFVRAARYSATDKRDYFREANRNLVILQIEGQSGISNMDEILAVDNFDIVFIGPYDLSQSMGLPGEISHPEVVRQMKNIVHKAREANKIVGTFTDTPAQVKLWRDAGVQYISYSVDVGIYYQACRDLLKTLPEL